MNRRGMIRMGGVVLATTMVLALTLPLAVGPDYAAYTKRVRRVVRRGTVQRAVWTSVKPSVPTPPPAPLTEQQRADSILASLRAAYPRYLAGVTVTIGTTPGDYQAVCYYREGRIVVSPTHAASLETILSHEIWHVIDWRDNGCIDWREDIPPANAADYRG